MKPLLAFIMLLILSSCAYYSVSKEEFLRQLSGQEKVGNSYVFVAGAVLRYEANNMKKILCLDKNGEKVWLYINQNTNLEVKLKNGKSEKAYFDTIVLDGDKITGLRSRILKMETVIPISEIQEIRIYAEMSKTEKYDGLDK